MSMALTWTEDRHLPILWKRGVTKMSVRLLQTTWTEGSAIRQLRTPGISTLKGGEKEGPQQQVQLCITNMQYSSSAHRV